MAVDVAAGMAIGSARSNCCNTNEVVVNGMIIALHDGMGISASETYIMSVVEYMHMQLE